MIATLRAQRHGNGEQERETSYGSQMNDQTGNKVQDEHWDDQNRNSYEDQNPAREAANGCHRIVLHIFIA